MPAVRTLSRGNTQAPPPSDPDMSAAGPSFQPFQCSVCQKRFTRHENLKRHAALHSTSAEARGLPCDHCSATFSRHDLRRRHVKNKHPEVALADEAERGGAGESAGEGAQGQPPRCAAPSAVPAGHAGLAGQLGRQGATPMLPIADLLWSDVPIDWDFVPPAPGNPAPSRALEAGDLWRDLAAPSAHSSAAQLGISSASRVSSTDGSDQGSQASLSPVALSTEGAPTFDQTERGVQLFFEHVAPYLPFIHEPTFDVETAPEHLVLAMLCVGLQYGDTPEVDRALAARCFRRARALLDRGDDAPADSARNLAVVQAYLLLQTAAIMYMCGRETAAGLRMHAKSIELARSGGLMEPYPTRPGATDSLNSLWLEFIKAESHKRTLLAVYQLDGTWYHILSIPRSLSHLEIKHDLPCSDALWALPTAAEWAHRSLAHGPGLAGRGGAARSGSSSSTGPAPSTRFIPTIRALLSPAPDARLPDLDAYGTLNLIHYLLASIREMSGWATMTGRLSMERFEALQAAMLALEPAPAEGEPTAQDIVVEATWNMGMIELNLWSPAHTGGIVEGSLDAALATATYFATTQSLLISPEIAASVEPYVCWFVRYLARAPSAAREPPWVAFYAYKAFLFAWQSLRADWVNMLAAVDVASAAGALAWARAVFGRRRASRVGTLIEKSLESLDAGSDEGATG